MCKFYPGTYMRCIRFLSEIGCDSYLQSTVSRPVSSNTYEYFSPIVYTGCFCYRRGHWTNIFGNISEYFSLIVSKGSFDTEGVIGLTFLVTSSSTGHQEYIREVLLPKESLDSRFRNISEYLSLTVSTRSFCYQRSHWTHVSGNISEYLSCH